MGRNVHSNLLRLIRDGRHSPEFVCQTFFLPLHPPSFPSLLFPTLSLSLFPPISLARSHSHSLRPPPPFFPRAYSVTVQHAMLADPVPLPTLVSLCCNLANPHAPTCTHPFSTVTICRRHSPPEKPVLFHELICLGVRHFFSEFHGPIRRTGTLNSSFY